MSKVNNCICEIIPDEWQEYIDQEEDDECGPAQIKITISLN